MSKISQLIEQIASDKNKIKKSMLGENTRNLEKPWLDASGTALINTNAKLNDLATAIDGIDNLGKIEGALEVVDGKASIKTGAGYTLGVDITLKALEAVYVTPGKTTQSITADSGKVLSEVIVKALDITSADQVAEKVLEGESIVIKSGDEVISQIDGTMPNNGSINKVVTTLGNTVEIPAGYTEGGTITVKLDPAELNITSPTGAVTPVINRVVKGENDTWIDASANAATTTAEANKVYVKVLSAANTSNFTPTVNVETLGYTDKTLYTGTPKTVGALASEYTYIPINTAEISVNSPASAVTPAISRLTFTGTDTLFDASNGAAIISDTLPTEGVYVKVNTAAQTSVYTPIANVDTSGYTTETSYTGPTTTVGANASKDTYIPIKQATIPDLTELNGGLEATITSGYLTHDLTITANAISGQTLGTATADKILTGSTAWVNGNKVTGTMANNTAVNATITKPGDSVSIPQGYHPEGGVVTANIEEGSVVITDSTLTTGETSAFAQGSVTLTPGWVESFNNGNTTIPGATFKNSATGSINYKDISETSAAPILVSDDYLYIDAGYTDNVKISLAKLVPNDANITPTTGADYMLLGTTAYDKDGKLVTGQILTVEGNTFEASTALKEIVTEHVYTGGAINLAAVTVNADATAENVVAGKIITVKSGNTVLYNLAGTFSSDATATEDDLLEGKTAYVNGVKVEGKLANKSGEAGNLTVNPYEFEMDEDIAGSGVTIPAGFYDGTSKVYISDDTYNALLAI